MCVGKAAPGAEDLPDRGRGCEKKTSVSWEFCRLGGSFRRPERGVWSGARWRRWICEYADMSRIGVEVTPYGVHVKASHVYFVLLVSFLQPLMPARAMTKFWSSSSVLLNCSIALSYCRRKRRLYARSALMTRESGSRSCAWFISASASSSRPWNSRQRLYRWRADGLLGLNSTALLISCSAPA